ncbi:MAG TPA: nitrilase, partial [Eubacteriaceae bacterium]|nr:nitrilase [Eubacteriaceae bacterium]
MTPIMNHVDANLKRGIQFIRQAEQEADLIVFPELWTTGYYLSKEAFYELAESRYGNTITLIREEAARYGKVIICPFVEKDEQGKVYISVAIIDSDGSITGVVRKSLLWGREQTIFSKGEISYPAFNTAGGNNR